VTLTDDTTTLSFLLSGWALLLALVGFYVVRSLWIARREWPECATDTKVLYLVVAPPLTLAVDVLQATDRLFWHRSGRKAHPRAPHSHRTAPHRANLHVASVRRGQLTSKSALRSNG
jgi:hypothetical protein